MSELPTSSTIIVMILCILVPVVWCIKYIRQHNTNTQILNNGICNKCNRKCKKTDNYEYSNPTLTIIINKSLKMTNGKIISQTSHLISSLYDKLYFDRSLSKWKKRGEPKIVLKATEMEIMELYSKYNRNKNKRQSQDDNKELDVSDKYLILSVCDAGKTQVVPGSLTCIGLFGETEFVKSDTKHLKLF